MIKVIGIGNRLMKDDGIAILILENIRTQLESIGIEVIIGETDFESCYYQINDEDFIIILDAVHKELSVGRIHIKNLQDAINLYGKPNCQHDISIFDLLKLYRKPLNGYFIGIEIAETGLGYGISENFKKKFDSICVEIEEIITTMVGCGYKSFE